MKNIYKYILFAALAPSAMSCKKFLKEEPRSVITEEAFYKTPEDAEYAVNATYFFYNGNGPNGTSQTAYQSLLNVGMDLASDDLYPGPGATNPDVRSLAVHNHSSANRTFFENWQQHYAGIRKSNVAIAKIPDINFKGDEAKKKRLIAEAKFNRAWIYFNLVRLWGDVPLVTEAKTGTEAKDFYIASSPAAVVYDQIERDLSEAAPDLNKSYSGSDIGRATQGAALALLAKVYLTKASFPLRLTDHYQKAVDQALKVITAGHVTGASGTFGYNLRPDYSHVFLPANKNNEEHIFSAQRTTAQSQGNNDFSRTLPRGIPGINGNYADQVNFYTKGDDKQFNIYKLYQDKDKRKRVSFWTRFKSPTDGKWYGTPLANPAYPGDSVPYINKTYDPNNLAVPSNSQTNVTLFRYSELLLILAEAENEVNGPTDLALEAYNKVRLRAGLDPFASGELTQSQFRDSLYLDRRLELVFEYQRWFDLIRQRDEAGQPIFVKSLHEAGKTNAQDRGRWFPIPQTEIDNNPLIRQHPLWQ